MADNTTLNSGSGGDVIATDDVGGVKFQRVKIAVGGDGVANDASSAYPVPTQETGELVEAIEALRMTIMSLTRSIGQMMPDTAGRQRVLLDAISASLTLGTVANITNLPTLAQVTTLVGQTNVGGWAATEQIPSLMRLGSDSLRRNIQVT